MACISRVLVGALRGVRDARDTREEELFSFPSSCALRSRNKTCLRAPKNACLPFNPWLLNASLDRNGFSSDINKWNEFSVAAALNYRDLLLCCYLGRRAMRIQRRCLTIESSVTAPNWRLRRCPWGFPVIKRGWEFLSSNSKNTL